jgi:hypothetical protein
MRLKKLFLNLIFIGSILISSCKKDDLISIDITTNKENTIVFIDYKTKESTYVSIKNKQHKILFEENLNTGKGNIQINIENYEKGDYFFYIEKTNSSFLAFTKD